MKYKTIVMFIWLGLASVLAVLIVYGSVEGFVVEINKFYPPATMLSCADNALEYKIISPGGMEGERAYQEVVVRIKRQEGRYVYKLFGGHWRGNYREWHPNGVLFKKGAYARNGKKTGEWFLFRLNGGLIRSENYGHTTGTRDAKIALKENDP